MSIIKYKALLSVLENQSITKTAELLGYTQPGISHMISSLEKEFGIPLLLRTAEGLFPTENATNIEYYMRQIVTAEDALREIVNKICGLESGSLRIGSFTSTSIYWLPSLIACFSQQHQNIDLQISEGIHGDLKKWLLSGSINLAFTSLPVPDKFDFIPLWEDPLLAVVSKDHSLAKKKSIHPRELAQSPFIIPVTGADETVWQVMNAEKLNPSIKFRIKGDMVTLAMIGRNLGVSIIPELALKVLPSEDIVTRPLTGNYFRTLGICINSIKHASPAAKEFIAMTEQFVQNQWKGPLKE